MNSLVHQGTLGWDCSLGSVATTLFQFFFKLCILHISLEKALNKVLGLPRLHHPLLSVHASVSWRWPVSYPARGQQEHGAGSSRLDSSSDGCFHLDFLLLQDIPVLPGYHLTFITALTPQRSIILIISSHRQENWALQAQLETLRIVRTDTQTQGHTIVQTVARMVPHMTRASL